MTSAILSLLTSISKAATLASPPLLIYLNRLLLPTGLVRFFLVATFKARTAFLVGRPVTDLGSARSAGRPETRQVVALLQQQLTGLATPQPKHLTLPRLATYLELDFVAAESIGSASR